MMNSFDGPTAALLLYLLLTTDNVSSTVQYSTYHQHPKTPSTKHYTVPTDRKFCLLVRPERLRHTMLVNISARSRYTMVDIRGFHEPEMPAVGSVGRRCCSLNGS